ncbi:hypothetical protein [Serratia proteamaculans]|uniref:hypothetical protein n=1 Tax=Serratia proteamaculans TaxID=28151 RepID=UPI000A1632C8|nr:hypothetical protein [Serratia proteamaculans]
MKNVLYALLLVFSLPATAGVTLILSDEQETSGGGKICIYENSQRTETITVGAGRSCPHTKTFD